MAFISFTVKILIYYHFYIFILQFIFQIDDTNTSLRELPHTTYRIIKAITDSSKFRRL